MTYGISSVTAVFGNGKAIRSESTHGVVWFYRPNVGTTDVMAFKEGDDDTHTVDLATVERNVGNDSSEVDTEPVDDSPFDVSD